MAYFTPDVIAREQLFGTESVPAAVEAVEAVIGAFPIGLRRRFTMQIPISLLIRRPIQVTAYMTRTIRTQFDVVLHVERLVRRRFMESFTQKRHVITPKFKKLLRTVYQFLKEE